MSTQLAAEEKRILSLIYSGHDTHCNLVDFMGKTAPDVMALLIKLEELGYLTPAGESLSEHLRYVLTEKGRNSLEISDKARMLAAKYGISEEDLLVLKSAKELGRKNHAGNVADKTGLKGLQVVCCAENLDKKGYIAMKGIIRCYFAVTPEGEKVLKEVG